MCAYGYLSFIKKRKGQWVIPALRVCKGQWAAPALQTFKA